MKTSFVTDYYQSYPPTNEMCKMREKKVLSGEVMKAKVGELECEVRAGFYRHLRKEFTGVLQGVSGKRILLARLQDICENFWNPL